MQRVSFSAGYFDQKTVIKQYAVKHMLIASKIRYLCNLEKIFIASIYMYINRATCICTYKCIFHHCTYSAFKCFPNQMMRLRILID